MNDQERAERRRHNLREQLRRANAERPPYCLRCGAPHTDPCKREEGT